MHPNLGVSTAPKGDDRARQTRESPENLYTVICTLGVGLRVLILATNMLLTVAILLASTILWK